MYDCEGDGQIRLNPGESWHDYGCASCKGPGKSSEEQMALILEERRKEEALTSRAADRS